MILKKSGSRPLQLLIINFSFFLFLSSCSVQKQIGRSAKKVIHGPALKTAHVGISIYEPATNTYWFNYQGDHYFVPASNTKIPTCYAAMKYLGDSLVGLRWEWNGEYMEIEGTGDPTFLHPDFKNQPVLDFLNRANKIWYVNDNGISHFSPFGKGWQIDDLTESYAPERSEMPIYGNVVRFFEQDDTITVLPKFFFNVNISYVNSLLRKGIKNYSSIIRPIEKNYFYFQTSARSYFEKNEFKNQDVPFKINEFSEVQPIPVFIELLEDTLHKPLHDLSWLDAPPKLNKIIHSQPTDSLLKPMMHHSDNFFAEQSLLMISNELLGYMNDEKIIDTLLKTDFKDLPQKPRWVDGSGLSRYNLFSPQDFVFIFNKMKNDFGMPRIQNILATGGTGTLSSYYKNEAGSIFAKTGTLSGVVSISGFLYTRKNKLLIFSVLVNNHNSSATAVRRAVEQFIEGIRNKY